MYFGIPTTLCILSLLIAVFSGSMGAFGAKGTVSATCKPPANKKLI